MTKFLWQHPPAHTVDFHCEEDDTPVSLWTKERACRTTSKRPERIVLKKFLPIDKPIEKVSGPLWAPKKEVLVTTYPVIPTPPASPSIQTEQKQQNWLWQPASSSPSTEVEPVTFTTEIGQPFLWSKSTASRVTVAPLVNVEAPKKFFNLSPLPVVSGSLWTLKSHKAEKPALWKKPEGYWRLPVLPLEKTPLWSALTAKRTTEQLPACPPGAVHKSIRINDMPAAATGSLWVATTMHEPVDMGVNWLAKSTVKLSTPVNAPLPTPSTTPTNTKQYLWSKTTASRTTTAIPERLADAKVNVRVYPDPVPAVGQLWSLEASKKEKEAKSVQVGLWKRPMEAWRMVSLVEIEEQKNAKLWIKATARRTTDAQPVKTVVKPVVREYELVSFAGVKGLWTSAEKQTLWQKAPVRTLAVQYPHIPLHRTHLWNAQSTSRSTDAAPIRLDANPKVRVNELPLVATKGNLWNETPRELPHLWMKPAVRTLAVQYPHIPLHKPLLWCAQSARRHTDAAPVRLGEVKARPQDDTPLPSFAGQAMWGNTSKKAVFVSQLWKKLEIPAVAAYNGPLWEKAHAARTTAASPIRTPVTIRPKDMTPLIKATGSLWPLPKPVLSLWKKVEPATGLWHSQRLTPSLFELKGIKAAKKQHMWANHPVNSRRADLFVDTERIATKPRDAVLPLSAVSGGLWSAPVKMPEVKMCERENFGLWTAKMVPVLRARTDTFSSIDSSEDQEPVTPTAFDSPALSMGGSSDCDEQSLNEVELDAPALPVKPMMTFLSNHVPHPHHQEESDVDSGSDGGVDVDDFSRDRCLVRTDTFNSIWCNDLIQAREENGDEEVVSKSEPVTPLFGGMNRFLVLTPPASPTVKKGKSKAKRLSLQEEKTGGRRMWMGRLKGVLGVHSEESDGEGGSHHGHHGWFGRKEKA